MITSSDENYQRASARPIQRVAVPGAGTMGHGIAQIAAAGYAVIIRDVNSDALDRGKQSIARTMRRRISGGRNGSEPGGEGFYK